jgi:ribonuclease-3
VSRRLPVPPITDHTPLLEALGTTVSHEQMILALTHRSYAYEAGGMPTNERLEFLGDSVLGLAVTEWLYTRLPDRPEGDLAKIRASVVNMHSLARVARTLGPGGLGAHLFLGRGEELTGGRDKDSILADGMESLLGAVHLDNGIETSRAVVLRLFEPMLTRASTLGAGLDWKTSLQELAAEVGSSAPDYRITSTGPDHDKHFTAVAVIDGRDLGAGAGHSKKIAEQQAAEVAFAMLRTEHPESGA